MKKKPAHTWWKRLVIIQAFCLFSWFSFGQDTLTLFYASGEFKLSPVNKELLREFTFSHNLKDLDSVFVLGYTDSTGNKRKNRKLAWRRAETVRNFVEELLPGKSPFHVLSFGEESESTNPRVNHRRVEFILYGKNYYQPEERNVIRLNSTGVQHGPCYSVYDSVMLNCYLSAYKRGASNYYKVRIPSYALPKVQLFSMSPASLQAKPLKWKTEKMGMFWWQQTVYTTLVKERDWNAYGLLIKQESDSVKPCFVCELDSVAPHFSYALSPDVAVMTYCQVYKRLFSKQEQLIVPTDFVNLNLPYYFDQEQDFPLQWYQRKGKQNSLVYYADIPPILNDSALVIYSNHRHCADSIEKLTPKFNNTIANRHVCPVNANAEYRAFSVNAELGFWKRAYLGLNMNYQVANLNLSYTIGMDYGNQLQNHLALDYVFWSKSAVKTREFSGRNSQDVHQYHPQWWTYAGLGAAFSNSFRDGSWETAPNLHLGFAYKQPYFPWKLERIFVELGAAYAFLKIKDEVQPFLRVGIRFNI